jgi:serine/threonine protein kinase
VVRSPSSPEGTIVSRVLPCLIEIEGFPGPFVLTSEAGRSRAVVYRATHPGFGERLAVKLFDTAGDSTLSWARQLRSIRDLECVTVPNLVPLYAHGAVVGRPSEYVVVMRYVPGHDAQDVPEALGARPGAPPTDALLHAVASMLLDVVDALDVLHARGLVHRDVKPSNVRMEHVPDPAGTGPGAWRASLIDTGHACRMAKVPLTDDTSPPAGTPAYFNRALLHGGVHDRATDRFALGLTAWHLLAGRLPTPTPEERLSKPLRLDDLPGLDRSPPLRRALAKLLGPDAGETTDGGPVQGDLREAVDLLARALSPARRPDVPRTDEAQDLLRPSPRPSLSAHDGIDVLPWPAFGFAALLVAFAGATIAWGLATF